jgi:hypothetical protein
MATATVPQPVNFTRTDLQAAITAALAKVTEDRWIRAIYRAAAHLAAGQFSYDGQQVILHSASSTKVYHITTNEPMTCTCKGHERGLICWHISAARLIVRAAEHHAAPPQPVMPAEEFDALTDKMNGDLFSALAGYWPFRLGSANSPTPNGSIL